MGGKRRGATGGSSERVRTHLLFAREHAPSTQKRKRRTHSTYQFFDSFVDLFWICKYFLDKLQVTNVHKKDEMVQTGGWSFLWI